MGKPNASKEQEGIVFNIQRYSIHDGPGIRTTVFLKGCPLQCFWCQNPESQAIKPQVLLNRSNCSSCGICITVCPTGASSLSDESSVINRSICIGCGKCAEACPNQARSLAGKRLTVSEIMTEVLKDRKFYDNSGGGVTLSGGDPTAQPDFALAIFKRCKEEGLHTTLDTCGYSPWPTLEPLLKYVDHVLYDIKCIDPEKHLEATGKSNDLILGNVGKIAGYKSMRIRVPLIPGFNDSPEEIKTIARFVKTELGPIEIDLLTYNKLGEGKYDRMDMAGVHLDIQSEEYVQSLEAIAKSDC